MLALVKDFLALTEEELKKPVILKQKSSVFYLLLNTKANTFTKPFVREIHSLLNEVEKSEGPAALVTISLSKLYSGGLDLKYITNLEFQDQRYFTLEFIALLGRISVFPMPTFTIVKGGAVAGGCMFAFAHDFIFVADSAMFACNEVDNGLPLPPGMMAVIKKKHTNHQSLRDMTLFAKKFSAEDAFQNKIIDKIIESKSILKETFDLANTAADYGNNRVNFKKLKSELHKEVIDHCFNKQHAVGSIGETTIPQFPKL